MKSVPVMAEDSEVTEMLSVIVDYWDVSHSELYGRSLDIIFGGCDALVFVCDERNRDSMYSVDAWLDEANILVPPVSTIRVLMATRKCHKDKEPAAGTQPVTASAPNSFDFNKAPESECSTLNSDEQPIKLNGTASKTANSIFFAQTSRCEADVVVQIPQVCVPLAIKIPIAVLKF